MLSEESEEMLELPSELLKTKIKMSQIGIDDLCQTFLANFCDDDATDQNKISFNSYPISRGWWWLYNMPVRSFVGRQGNE